MNDEESIKPFGLNSSFIVQKSGNLFQSFLAETVSRQDIWLQRVLYVFLLLSEKPCLFCLSSNRGRQKRQGFSFVETQFSKIEINFLRVFARL